MANFDKRLGVLTIGKDKTGNDRRIKLPKADAMKKDWKKWLKREEKLDGAEQMIWFQGDYVKELIAATDYPSFDALRADLWRTVSRPDLHEDELIQTLLEQLGPALGVLFSLVAIIAFFWPRGG